MRAVVMFVIALTLGCGDRKPGAQRPGDGQVLEPAQQPVAVAAAGAVESSSEDAGADTRGPAAGSAARALVVDSSSANELERIPNKWIKAAKGDLRIFFGRLSHGDQMKLGMDIIAADNAAFSYSKSFFEVFYSSLDPRPNTPQWEPATRKALSSGEHNVVMWAWSSWIGKPDKVDEAFVAERYLAKMEQLERDFPKVRFVYFTGPAQTWRDPDGNMAARNKQIRDYAIANGKVLFDVEDIELRDPSGKYHADGTDACEWCATWCAANDCAPAAPGGCCGDTCKKCSEWSHSHCFNCYRKGRAFWYLAARLSGWSGN